jgi:hypothetical protein
MKTMTQRSEEGLFDVLEKILRKSNEPLDCVEIYDQSAEVRDRAANPNRVSDYLGNMWRKGLLVRLPAPRGEGKKARWLYAWKGKEKQKPDLAQAIAFDGQVNTILSKPNLQIEEDGKLVTISLPGIVITIKQTDE